MMIIRPEQLSAFRESRLQEFAGRLAQHIRQHHAGEIRIDSDEKLVSLVREGIRKAQERGIKREPSIAAFVRMLVAVSPKFYEHPAIARILQESGSPADARVSRLFRVITKREWEEASRL